MMGPYTNADVKELEDTAGNAWSVLTAEPAQTGNQVSYFDASNAMYFGLNQSVIGDKLPDSPFEFRRTIARPAL